MKTVNEWDFSKREYKERQLPEDWNASLYEADMEKKINCASCGEVVLYGDCYTSRKIHSSHGFGYSVCEKCYEKEKEEEREATK